MSGLLHLDIALAFGDYSLSAKADVPLVGITGLQGDSGSGKTTLLRAIAGLEPRAKGVIRFGDTTWLSDSVNLRPQARRIGYVFQDTRLFKHLDVAQNLAFGHKRAGAAPAVLQRVIEALDLSDLLTRQVAALSGGEKQRVAIGRALAMQPQLLLLDEPMSGLDQARCDETLSYIAAAVREIGCPAIYVSHSKRETAMLADQTMRISNDVGLERALRGVEKCETVLRCVAKPATTGGDVVLFVAAQETAMPAKAANGALFDLRVNGASVVLSLQDPGRSTALMTLPAKLDLVEPVPADAGADHVRLQLQGAGWSIALIRSKSECAALRFQQGQDLWVSIVEAKAYPAQS